MKTNSSILFSTFVFLMLVISALALPWVIGMEWPLASIYDLAVLLLVIGALLDSKDEPVDPAKRFPDEVIGTPDDPYRYDR